MQENLAEQARQGNIEAIAAIVNLQLQLNPQFKDLGIVATLSLSQDCLLVWLQSPQASDREALVAQIRKTLTALAVPTIARVQVYGIQQGQTAPAWTDEFHMNEVAETSPTQVEVDSSDSAQSYTTQPKEKQTRSQDPQPRQIPRAQPRSSNAPNPARRNLFKYFLFGLLGFLGVAIGAAFIPGSPVNRFVAWFLCAVLSFEGMCLPLLPESLRANTNCNLSLNGNSIKPAQEIVVKGVPASFTEINLRIWMPGSKEPTPVFGKRLSNGDVTVVAPIYPTEPMKGGDIMLIISSGKLACSPVKVKVEALPKGNGTLRKIYEKLQNAIQAKAAKYGLSIADLQGDIDKLPEELKSLGVMQMSLDHPQNPDSLIAILNGTAPVLKDQKINLSLLEGVAISSGLTEFISKYINEFSSEIASEPVSVLPNKPYAYQSMVYNNSPSIDFKVFAPYQISKQIEPIEKECKNIDTVEELESNIKSAINADEREENKTALDRYLALVVNSTLSLVPTILFSGMAIDPEPESKFILFILFIFGTFFSVTPLILLTNARRDIELLPREVTKIEFDVDASKFEKSQSSKKYEPMKGEYRKVTVNAKGNIFQLSISEILSWVGLFASQLGLLLKGSEVLKMVADAVGIYTDTFNSKVAPFLKKVPGIGTPLGPCEYEVDINKESIDKYLEAKVDKEGIISLGNTNEYKPVSAGEVNLKLSNKPDILGKKKTDSKPKKITVIDESACPDDYVKCRVKSPFKCWKLPPREACSYPDGYITDKQWQIDYIQADDGLKSHLCLGKANNLQHYITERCDPDLESLSKQKTTHDRQDKKPLW